MSGTVFSTAALIYTCLNIYASPSLRRQLPLFSFLYILQSADVRTSANGRQCKKNTKLTVDVDKVSKTIKSITVKNFKIKKIHLFEQ